MTRWVCRYDVAPPMIEPLEQRLMLSTVYVDTPLEIRFDSTLATQLQQSWGMNAQSFVNQLLSHVNSMFDDPGLVADYNFRQAGSLTYFSSGPTDAEVYYSAGPSNAAARVWFHSDPALAGTSGAYQYISGNRTIEMALPSDFTSRLSMMYLGNTLTHELAHLNGALDLYCVEVDSDEAILPGQGVDEEVVGLTYPYPTPGNANWFMGGGDSYLGPRYAQQWDAHSLAVMNRSAPYLASAPYVNFDARDAFYTLQNAKYWTPSAVVLRVVDQQGRPLTGREVEIYQKKYNDTFVDASSRMDGTVDFAGVTSAGGDYLMPLGADLFNSRNVVALINVDGAEPMFVDITQWNLAYWNQSGVYELTVVARQIGGPLDFNGDNMNDIFWRHAPTGQNAVWFMNGATNIGGVMLPAVGDNAWEMRGLGDFNGDGGGDILWRHSSTGQTCLWYMSNGSHSGGVFLPTQSDLSWDISAVADMNNDGQADIIWSNRSTGAVALWLMSLSQVQSSMLLQSQTGDAMLAGAGDFNGDGANDLLWRQEDGSNFVWLMNGTQYVSSSAIESLGADWQVAGVADYDGDGKVDVFWRNIADGSNILWKMNGLVHVATSQMPTLADQGWASSGQRLSRASALVQVNGQTVAAGAELPLERARQGRTAAEAVFRITNVGSQDLILSDLRVPEGYQLLSAPQAVVAPGMSTTFSISMTTQISGARRGTVSFATNDARMPVFSAAVSGVVASINDLSGDGLADLLWRHEITGESCAWLVTNATNTGGWHLPTFSSAEWQIRGTGDFNRDGHSDIVWRNTATGDNVVWFMANGANVGGANLQPLADINWDIAAVADLNGDGQDDLIWRNNATGQNHAWLMSGAIIGAQAGLAAWTDANWRIVAAADFNADGKSDLLWRHRLSGQNTVWLMNGVTYSSSVQMQSMAPNWQVAAVDDYDATGSADIIWRNQTDGGMLVWLMNGASVSATRTLPAVADEFWHTAGRTEAVGRVRVSPPAAMDAHGVIDLGVVAAGATRPVYAFTVANDGRETLELGLASVPAGFGIVQNLPSSLAPGQSAQLIIEVIAAGGGVRSGVVSFANNDPRVGVWSGQISVTVAPRGDINGDGMADILWRNAQTGQNCIWYMAGATNIGGTDIPTLTDANWMIKGAGDFNSDGHSDIVWRNQATGDNAVWYMRDGRNIGGIMLESWADNNWDIDAVADLNGDGQNDLLWRNSASGSLFGWLMSGPVLAAPVGITGEGDLAWRIVGAADMTGDGMADILWRNENTNSLRIWRMNGTSYHSTIDVQSTMSSEWYVGQVADFSGNGLGDVLWRNSVTGENVIWLMNGSSLGDSVALTPVTDPGWRVV
jgi:hypothetical protein